MGGSCGSDEDCWRCCTVQRPRYRRKRTIRTHHPSAKVRKFGRSARARHFPFSTHDWRRRCGRCNTAGYPTDRNSPVPEYGPKEVCVLRTTFLPFQPPAPPRAFNDVQADHHTMQPLYHPVGLSAWFRNRACAPPISMARPAFRGIPPLRRDSTSVAPFCDHDKKPVILKYVAAWAGHQAVASQTSRVRGARCLKAAAGCHDPVPPRWVPQEPLTSQRTAHR